MPNAVIRSEGDLEAVALYEGHDLLAQLVGPALYRVAGTAPHQVVNFHSQQTYDLFLILLMEFVAEGARSAFIEDRFHNLSLLSSLRRVAGRHPHEARNAGLNVAISKIEVWLRREVPFEFWYPDGEIEVRFNLPNTQLLSFGANTTKHRLLRLSELIAKVGRYCEAAGYQFDDQQALSVLRTMIDEVHSRLTYHSSYLAELAGGVFFALNLFLRSRFEANPTNRWDEVIYPEGITSEVFRSLYLDALVFKQYTDQRIQDYTPITSELLRRRYQ